jgi:hypothetical protein
MSEAKKKNDEIGEAQDMSSLIQYALKCSDVLWYTENSKFFISSTPATVCGLALGHCLAPLASGYIQCMYSRLLTTDQPTAFVDTGHVVRLTTSTFFGKIMNEQCLSTFSQMPVTNPHRLHRLGGPFGNAPYG